MKRILAGASSAVIFFMAGAALARDKVEASLKFAFAPMEGPSRSISAEERDILRGRLQFVDAQGGDAYDVAVARPIVFAELDKAVRKSELVVTGKLQSGWTLEARQ